MREYTVSARRITADEILGPRLGVRVHMSSPRAKPLTRVGRQYPPHRILFQIRNGERRAAYACAMGRMIRSHVPLAPPGIGKAEVRSQNQQLISRLCHRPAGPSLVTAFRSWARLMRGGLPTSPGPFRLLVTPHSSPVIAFNMIWALNATPRSGIFSHTMFVASS